jgi:hypothetical protein
MDKDYPNSSFLIYFSGDARRYKLDDDNYGVMCTFADKQEVDLREIVQTIEVNQLEELEKYLSHPET